MGDRHGGQAWVLGAGGLVGRHVAARLTCGGVSVRTSRVPWADPIAALAVLGADLTSAMDGASGDAPLRIFWCAGAGVVATGEEALRAEGDLFAAYVDLLATRAAGGVPIALTLASSAGGVYAGSAHPPFTEATPPRPLVEYGRTKLAMEERAAMWAREHGQRLLVARLANVYGPGQALDKGQGLVSQLVLTQLQRRPLPLRVSLDTLRDYVHAADAATVMVAASDRLLGEPSGSVVVKIVATGAPATVGHLVAEARRVIKRPVRMILDARGGAGQVLDLRLRSSVWTDLDALATTGLAAGFAATVADIRSEVAVRPGPVSPA